MKKVICVLVAGSLLVASTGFARDLQNLSRMPAATTEELVKKSKTSQLRMAIFQIQVLKKMQDLGYVVFERNEASQVTMEITSNKIGLAQKKTEANESAHNLLILGIGSYGSGAVTAAGASAVNGAGRYLLAETVGAVAGLSVVVGSATAGYMSVGLTNDVSRLSSLNDAEIKAELAVDKLINDALNAQISQTENLFALKTNATYMSRRTELASKFKSNSIDAIMKGLIEKKEIKSISITTYKESLAQTGLIPADQSRDVGNITEFLANLPTEETNLNQIQLGKVQARELLSVVEKMIPDATSKDLYELRRLQNDLFNEIELLKLMEMGN